MAEPAKFLFERNFDTSVAVQEAERASAEAERQARFEQELEAARREAQAQGFGEGRQAAAETVEARLAEALEALLERTQHASNHISGECDGIRAQAITLARTMAETLAGELVRREPVAELEALFSECLAQVTHAPHLAVRVNDGLLEPVEERLQARARERGFEGQLVVLGDPEMAIGDGRIEWADGGIARDMGEVMRSIDSVVGRYVRQAGEQTVRNGSDTAAELLAGGGVPHDDSDQSTGVSGEMQ